jgi:hypothetical protein
MALPTAWPSFKQRAGEGYGNCTVLRTMGTVRIVRVSFRGHRRDIGTVNQPAIEKFSSGNGVATLDAHVTRVTALQVPWWRALEFKRFAEAVEKSL